jgi:malonate decarboxylase gamma subunit
MTIDAILASLFPGGHDVGRADGLLMGSGRMEDGGAVTVIGVIDHTALGVDEALALSAHVLGSGTGPILVLVDSASQRMSKRDELLGLNEFLAHLAKCLVVADLNGRLTVGLLYGRSAAGAFIATALATRVLVALPGAEPTVMDLPSMARVTKLSLETLEAKAKSTPVFAPGLDNLAAMGAVHEMWDPHLPLSAQLATLFARGTDTTDRRGRLGAERAGRPKAAAIAERVHALALEDD